MSIEESEKIDAVGVKNGVLHLILSDHAPWDDDFLEFHLEALQDKINYYLMYIESKQYEEKYGDDFDKIIIDIFFKYNLIEESVNFLNEVSFQINPHNIYLNLHLPKA